MNTEEDWRRERELNRPCRRCNGSGWVPATYASGPSPCGCDEPPESDASQPGTQKPSGFGVNHEPVPVTIFCPVCAVPHIDEGEWATTRSHKTHQCQGCGHEWRPFPFATVGIPHPGVNNENHEALREKVKAAVGALRRNRIADHPGGPKVHDGLGWANMDEVVSAILAALQSGGEGG